MSGAAAKVAPENRQHAMALPDADAHTLVTSRRWALLLVAVEVVGAALLVNTGEYVVDRRTRAVSPWAALAVAFAFGASMLMLACHALHLRHLRRAMRRGLLLNLEAVGPLGVRALERRSVVLGMATRGGDGSPSLLQHRIQTGQRLARWFTLIARSACASELVSLGLVAHRIVATDLLFGKDVALCIIRRGAAAAPSSCVRADAWWTVAQLAYLVCAFVGKTSFLREARYVGYEVSRMQGALARLLRARRCLLYKFERAYVSDEEIKVVVTTEHEFPELLEFEDPRQTNCVRLLAFLRMSFGNKSLALAKLREFSAWRSVGMRVRHAILLKDMRLCDMPGYDRVSAAMPILDLPAVNESKGVLVYYLLGAKDSDLEAALESLGPADTDLFAVYLCERLLLQVEGLSAKHRRLFTVCLVADARPRAMTPSMKALLALIRRSLRIMSMYPFVVKLCVWQPMAWVKRFIESEECTLNDCVRICHHTRQLAAHIGPDWIPVELTKRVSSTPQASAVLRIVRARSEAHGFSKRHSTPSISLLPEPRSPSRPDGLWLQGAEGGPARRSRRPRALSVGVSVDPETAEPQPSQVAECPAAIHVPRRCSEAPLSPFAGLEGPGSRSLPTFYEPPEQDDSDNEGFSLRYGLYPAISETLKVPRPSTLQLFRDVSATEAAKVEQVIQLIKDLFKSAGLVDEEDRNGEISRLTELAQANVSEAERADTECKLGALRLIASGRRPESMPLWCFGPVAVLRHLRACSAASVPKIAAACLSCVNAQVANGLVADGERTVDAGLSPSDLEGVSAYCTALGLASAPQHLDTKHGIIPVFSRVAAGHGVHAALAKLGPERLLRGAERVMLVRMLLADALSYETRRVVNIRPVQQLSGLSALPDACSGLIHVQELSTQSPAFCPMLFTAPVIFLVPERQRVINAVLPLMRLVSGGLLPPGTDASWGRVVSHRDQAGRQKAALYCTLEQLPRASPAARSETSVNDMFARIVQRLRRPSASERPSSAEVSAAAASPVAREDLWAVLPGDPHHWRVRVALEALQ